MNKDPMQNTNPEIGPSTGNSTAESPKRYSLATLVAAVLGGILVTIFLSYSLFGAKRLNAKSDEVFSRFAEKLDAKATAISVQLADFYRLQSEQFTSNSAMLSAQFEARATASSTQMSDTYRLQSEQFTSNSAMLSAQFAAKESAVSAQLSNYYRLMAEQFHSNSTILSGQFAENLNAKATEVANRLSNEFRTQADHALATKSAEFMLAISNSVQKQLGSLATAVGNVELEVARPEKERAARRATLLTAAGQFDSESQSELAELCYLSAFSLSGSDSGSALKQFMQWKRSSLAKMAEDAILTNGATMVLSIFQTLDRAIPESKASPAEMKEALTLANGIKKTIEDRQLAQLRILDTQLQWDGFNQSQLESYRTKNSLLASISPVSDAADAMRTQTQERLEQMIQTAQALSSSVQTTILPPSPKAPNALLAKWCQQVAEQLHQRGNSTETKISAFAVLHEFVVNNSNLPPCQTLCPQLENEATLLASLQWRDRHGDLAKAHDEKLKSDAETLAAEQVLLNQGAELVRAAADKSSVALVTESLPIVAKDMFLLRQRAFQDMARALPSTEFKEKRARARSMLASQIMSATMELRLVQQDLQKLGCSDSGAGNTSSVLADLEGYLTAFEKEDAAGGIDERARHLEEQRQQYARYANYCEAVIATAREHFNRAETLANEWFTSWSDDGPQSKLSQGLTNLYSIDINDLNRANPGIAAEWSIVEEKLKKEFKKSPSTINAKTSKKSLLDFQP